jgi:HEAT repeat protein
MAMCWAATVVQAVPGRDLVVPAGRTNNLQPQLEALIESQQIEGLKWNTSFETALALAGKHNKAVLVYFWDPDCGWCKRLEQETLQPAEMRRALGNLILLRVNIMEDLKTPARFRVRGTPTLILLSPEGRESQRFSGFIAKEKLLESLTAILGNQLQKQGDKIVGLVELLKNNKLPDENWPEVLLGLANEQYRPTILSGITAATPQPRSALTKLLEHPLLAVRLGALEALEELAGEDYGFNPWLDQPERNKDALAKWRQWSTTTNQTAQVQFFQTLTADEVASYLRDLLADDRERTLRAQQMLQRGGQASLEAISNYLSDHPTLPAGTRHKLQEIRYSLILPKLQGLDPASLAHRLVFGNLDLRLRALRDAAAARQRAVPVIQDFLNDPEPLIRETAVEALVNAGGRRVVPVFEEHLKKEKDANVIYLILKQLGNLPSKAGLKLLTGYLTNANEDLVVVALDSIAKLNSRTVSTELGKCLEDPRWRVRVAALKAVTTLQLTDLAPAIIARLEDKDEFVRITAVEAISRVGAKNSTDQLAALFVKDDSLKGPIIKAWHASELTVSEAMVKALEGKPASVLLGLIGQLDSVDAKVLPLLQPLAAHRETDVAAAALRLIASRGLKLSAYQNIVGEQMRSGDLRRIRAIMDSMELEESVVLRYQPGIRQAQLDSSAAPPPSSAQQTVADKKAEDLFSAFDAKPVPAPVATPAKAAPAKTTADDIFGAFETPAAGGATASTENFYQTFQRVGKELLQKKEDPQLQQQAAIFLLKLGDLSGVETLTARLDHLSVEERMHIAHNLERARQGVARPLIVRLLNDPVEEIRQVTANSLVADGANESCVRLIFDELLRPGSRLRPEETMGYQWQNFIRKPASRSAVQKAVADLLTRPGNADLATFGLILVKDVWNEEMRQQVLRYTQSSNSWQRRAAWYALGKNQPEEFQKRIAEVTGDPAAHVRIVVPSLYTSDSSWANRFDETRAGQPDYSYTSSFGRSSKTLPEEVKKALNQLTGDSSETVRFEAYYSLLVQREKIDLGALGALLENLPRNSALLERLSEYLRSNYRTLGKTFAVLLPYLNVEDKYNRQRAEEVKAYFGMKDEDEETPAVTVASRIRPKVEATFATPVTAAAAVKPENFKLVFFFKPGCDVCDHVRRLLGQLKESFPDLAVLEYDINKTSSVLLNEALSERFSVPANVRLVAPSVFTGSGYLTKEDITMERLGSMLLRAGEIPVVNWLEVPAVDLATAHQNITTRYQTTGLGLIVAAGFLDGLNPCAFATIIFLLSYLQVARKRPVEIAQIGISYILGVFATYYIIGMGLVKLSAGLSQLRWAGLALTYGMAAFALVIMLLSIRDGVRCLQGRMGDMTLQMPDFLKNRIHQLIRISVRQAHFILIAFFVGAAISVMELACTGQVYLPTITYMIQQGESGAFLRLLFYNLAFIVPLTVIFLLAYGGLRSDTLLAFFKRHAAFVKFATAALFLAIFLMLVLGRLAVH